MWCRSAVNFSFPLCLAACRTRPSAWVTRSRPCVRSVLCWSAFPSVSGLGSTDSAAGRPRSEERRVGKECRSRWTPHHEKKKRGDLEVLMSSVKPAELWQDCGGWEQYVGELRCLNGRHRRTFCFGPIHVSYISYLSRNGNIG